MSCEIKGLTIKEGVMSELKTAKLRRGIDTFDVPFLGRVPGSSIVIAADQCHLDLTVPSAPSGERLVQSKRMTGSAMQ